MVDLRHEESVFVYPLHWLRTLKVNDKSLSVSGL